MKKPLSILFTKTVSQTLKSQLQDWEVTDIPFIDVTFKDFAEIEPHLLAPYDYGIITSQKALAVIEKCKPNYPFYVVGNQSKKGLESMEIPVIHSAYNAQELASVLMRLSEKSKGVYFCSEQRLPYLSEIFMHHNRQLTEVVTYKTLATPYTVEESFDAYVFYSPSAVKSFMEKNTICPNSCIFALGKTTQEEVKQWCDTQVIIPKHPTEASLVETLIAYANDTK